MEISPVRPVVTSPVQAVKKAEQVPAKGREEKPDKVEELETRRQTLQNQIVQMKSATDAGGLTSETVKVLEKQLEEVASALKTAKAGALDGAKAASPGAPRFDEYVEGMGQEPSPGLYEVQGDGEGGYQVSYMPYSEDGEEAAPAGDKEGLTKTTINTDKVDAEIRKLNEEKSSLEEQIGHAQSSGDQQKADALKRKLASLDAELSAKDNDTYRKQHASVVHE